MIYWEDMHVNKNIKAFHVWICVDMCVVDYIYILQNYVKIIIYTTHQVS